MKHGKADVNIFVKGLQPVDASALAEYERKMENEAIPEIIKDVEKRRMLAAESRQRRLELPKAETPVPNDD